MQYKWYLCYLERDMIIWELCLSSFLYQYDITTGWQISIAFIIAQAMAAYAPLLKEQYICIYPVGGGEDLVRNFWGRVHIVCHLEWLDPLQDQVINALWSIKSAF